MGVCIDFLNEEYLIAPVDFIVALRRTKGRGRRTLRSPPSPSSGLHLIHPGCPLRRGMTAAAGLGQYWNPVSGAGRLSPVPNFVRVLCVRAGIARVSVGLPSLYRSFFIIGRVDRSCLRLRGVLLWSIVGFALTAIGSFVLAGNGMG